jgi:lipopolysaccharide/colanic/teichoic acid biosynthesis glycosyltransferase
MSSTSDIGFYEVGKRIMDIFGGLVGVILFSIPMAIAAIYIKLVSPEGPVMADIPARVGIKGKEFKMYKFRSMIPNAHEWMLNHPEVYEKYKANNYKLEPSEDPRLLKGAAFYRKTSIDELPQFFNILKGEMSLVGPRAYYPFEIKDQSVKFGIDQDLIAKVISVKPGLTGVWQISGRSATSFSDRIKMDAEYASKRSLVYDLLIILKTPKVVLSRKGAY